MIAESLGKKGKGLLPVISSLPKDNHSVMQLYLDGFKNNFFTFFYVHEKNSPKIINKYNLSSQNFLKNKNLNQILYAQKKATENIGTNYTTRRKMVNEDELVSILTNNNFTEIFLENYSNNYLIFNLYSISPNINGK